MINSAEAPEIDFEIYKVLGIPIAATTLDSASAAILNWSKDNKGRYVGVRDVASLMVMAEDPQLLALSQKAAVNLPDGMPLVWIGKSRGLPVQRTCGPDLMDLVCRNSPETGLKHFFYGGKEGVADQLADVFRLRAPGIEIVGTYCPPFRTLRADEDAQVVRKIKESEADIVWVGISSPKQDIWMRDHVDVLPQTLIGVGAAFDFHSGAIKRAPIWMQRFGLEWLHRLTSEPKRLWRRYLVQAPKFVFRVALSSSRDRD
jgi:N-acetylglucosaminyldiphosphoundecaprenol N-acetyl-beta-D-mannosaminyltransferase